MQQLRLINTFAMVGKWARRVTPDKSVMSWIRSQRKWAFSWEKFCDPGLGRWLSDAFNLKTEAAEVKTMSSNVTTLWKTICGFLEWLLMPEVETTLCRWWAVATVVEEKRRTVDAAVGGGQRIWQQKWWLWCRQASILPCDVGWLHSYIVAHQIHKTYADPLRASSCLRWRRCNEAWIISFFFVAFKISSLFWLVPKKCRFLEICVRLSEFFVINLALVLVDLAALFSFARTPFSRLQVPIICRSPLSVSRPDTSTRPGNTASQGGSAGSGLEV